MTVPRTAIAMSIAVVLTLVACGGDDDSTSTPAGQNDSATPLVTAADDASANTDSNNSDSGGGDIPPGFSSDECKAVAAQFGAAMAMALMPADQQAEATKQFETLKDKVPADIRDDVDTVATAMQDWYQRVKDDPQAANDIASLVSDPDFQKAADNVQAYFDDTCPELG